VNTKLINKLNRLELQIEMCMDAIDSSWSKTDEIKQSKILDKLMREKEKIERKIEKKSQDQG
jgi:succinylglutamate desuccinylase|tara:strand:- start:105 stop:290 length:186 start_codon:yes stop_codon:yes gene_type:complete